MKEENKQKIHTFLDELQWKDQSTYMDLCYKSIVSQPEEVFLLQATLSHKSASIDRIIQYYASREEFEKCITLKTIKEQLKQENK